MGLGLWGWSSALHGGSVAGVLLFQGALVALPGLYVGIQGCCAGIRRIPNEGPTLRVHMGELKWCRGSLSLGLLFGGPGYLLSTW